MRKPLIAGNWKMNGSRASIEALIRGLVDEFERKPLISSEVMVIPSFVHTAWVADLLVGSKIELGAQDTDHRSDGAVTGAVSAAMLKDSGCQAVLVGHSERRILFAEDDATIARKFESVVAAGMTPILCVGETLEQRRAGKALEVVTRQLVAVMDYVGPAQMTGSVIAYEPVWAIGTGESASPEQAEEIHICLRECLTAESVELGAQTRLLYGGSVNPENADALFRLGNIDGALVGGASLEVTSYVEICRIAETLAAGLSGTR